MQWAPLNSFASTVTPCSAAVAIAGQWTRMPDGDLMGFSGNLL